MDFVDTALARVPSHDVLALVLSFGTGLATSVGPCVAPRYLAIVSMTSSPRGGRAGLLGAFVAGTLCVYAVIAATGSFVVRLAAYSAYVYLLLAIALGAAGLRQVWNASGSRCSHRAREFSTHGGAFCLGAASSLAISPCCTPILVAFGTLSAAAPSPLALLPLVVSFTAGHLAPLAFVLIGADIRRDLAAGCRWAIETVTGAIAIALGLYYLVLA